MEAVLQERDESEVHRSVPRQLFSVPTVEQSGLAHQICVHSVGISTRTALAKRNQSPFF